MCEMVPATAPANRKHKSILQRAPTWNTGCMGWLLPLSVLAFVACSSLLIGSLVWRGRRRRRDAAMLRLSRPLPRVRLRSQVIVLPMDSSEDGERDCDDEARIPDKSRSGHQGLLVSEAPSVRQAPVMNEAADVHSAPTREFAAYVEELAALSMLDSPTRELAVHEAPTREFAAYLDEPLLQQPAGLPPPSRAASEQVGNPSGFHPRMRTARERCDDDATLKVPRGETQGPRAPSVEQLLRMLGPSPAPDLGNIEIYHRLGVAYLAAHNEEQARLCFLTVEGISRGYRDAAAHLAVLPIHAPTSSGAMPVHRTVTTSGYLPTQSPGASIESAAAQRRRNGR